MTLPVFPDVEAILREALTTFVTSPDNIGTVTPPDLLDRLHFIRVRRVGGADNWITDLPRFDVEVHATTASEALQVSREVQQALISGPVKTTSGILDRCRTEVGPREIPHLNDNLRLVIATYRGSVRR